MKKAKQLLRQAKQIAETVESWADLSNSLYNPVDGLITTAYPLGAARDAFRQTDEYKQIQELLGKSMDKFGLVEGAAPKKSGRFVVRMPQTLHAALEREAADEGVSLNQLVVAKLAIPLSRMVQRRARVGTGSQKRHG